MAPELVVLAPAEWAPRVAERLHAYVAARPAARIVLPTGDTPRPVYRCLCEGPARGAFAQATIVALDEWLDLAPDDPARCDVRIRADLLAGLMPEPAFQPIEADGSDPERAAADHDRVAAGGIDLALVGLGGNGHVGFNEPGSGPDSPTRVIRLAATSRAAASERYGAKTTPERGITLGMDRLLAAHDLWLLVTGAHKADVLRVALEGPEDPAVPASFLRRHPRLVVLADTRAAAPLAGSA